MTAYILCEGEQDAQLLKRLLPQEFVNDVEVIAAGGLSSVKSLARSLIVRRQAPVAIVADADAVVSEQVEQRRKDTEEIVSNIAVHTPVKVILVVPTLETVFFQDAPWLARLLGHSFSQEIHDLATYQPQKALAQLIAQSEHFHSQTQLVEQLTDEDLAVLRQAPSIQEMLQFLQSVRETVDAV